MRPLTNRVGFIDSRRVGDRPGPGVLRVGFEELPLRDVSMDEKVELEAPDHVTIPLGTEAIVPAQWRAHPNWREPCGMVEPLAGQTISDLVVGHALVSTKSPHCGSKNN